MGINRPIVVIAPPKIYNLPRRIYRSNVTIAVTTSAQNPVMGRAKVKYQSPSTAKLIYSKYSAATANEIGTKITGLGFLNQNGSTVAVYSSISAPIT